MARGTPPAQDDPAMPNESVVRRISSMRRAVDSRRATVAVEPVSRSGSFARDHSPPGVGRFDDPRPNRSAGRHRIHLHAAARDAQPALRRHRGRDGADRGHQRSPRPLLAGQRPRDLRRTDGRLRASRTQQAVDRRDDVLRVHAVFGFGHGFGLTPGTLRRWVSRVRGNDGEEREPRLSTSSSRRRPGPKWLVRPSGTNLGPGLRRGDGFDSWVRSLHRRSRERGNPVSFLGVGSGTHAVGFPRARERRLTGTRRCPLLRRPGGGRDPSGLSFRAARTWAPACAGVTWSRVVA